MIIYFTSDLHLGHTNILKYTNRPFKSIQEMNEKLIFNINQRVKENDMIIHIGDFCFKRGIKEAPDSVNNPFEYFRNKINCKNLTLCLGNHDGNRNKVKTPIESLVIDIGSKRMFVTHDPKWAKPEYEFNLCGHTHNKYGKFRKLGNKSVIVDVGVDSWDYQPITVNEIFSAYHQWRKGGFKNETIC